MAFDLCGFICGVFVKVSIVAQFNSSGENYDAKKRLSTVALYLKLNLWFSDKLNIVPI
jgi:hypothetical protein